MKYCIFLYEDFDHAHTVLPTWVLNTEEQLFTDNREALRTAATHLGFPDGMSKYFSTSVPERFSRVWPRLLVR